MSDLDGTDMILRVNTSTGACISVLTSSSDVPNKKTYAMLGNPTGIAIIDIPTVGPCGRLHRDLPDHADGASPVRLSRAYYMCFLSWLLEAAFACVS
eukprot:gnl/TRDRNA2_/TRDRNA2_110855_c0_seq1.p2 gnl/TRDRNA2_/TRDRNA2_110855_c0~~gnl/TRDRNA2_/TRDRNA2_110855_c0_seq1.p2  ORF type:complete len:104 (-),score=2.75 gnl/TRDRNA2_/TRDRNA2_110855_c0_seq1:3-293(-)